MAKGKKEVAAPKKTIGKPSPQQPSNINPAAPKTKTSDDGIVTEITPEGGYKQYKEGEEEGE